MKYAACCESQIQLMALLNFAYNVLGEDDECDLFISEVRLESDEQWRRIVESKVFSNVYRWRYRLLGQKLKLISSMGHLFKDLLPQQYLKYIIRENFHMVEYDFIVSSSINLVAQLLEMSIPNIKLIGTDDGIGSYSLDYKKLLFTSSMKGRAGNNKINPTCLYLSNIKFYAGDKTKGINELPNIKKWSDDYKLVFDEIFPVKGGKVYDKRKIIYLSQPMNDLLLGDYKESICDKKIISIIAQYHENIVLRRHPRDVYTKIKGAILDDKRLNWEALCANIISEEHVLIGPCSTAQFSPKMMYDMEPYIVFTFNLYNDIDNGIRHQYSLLVKKLVLSYRNKQKIFIPTNIDEFSKIMIKFSLL